MTRKASSAAFTLIEMLVVISIIVVLASFAVPAVISGLTKGQMVGTLNNARQLFLAGQQMALDGSTNGDTNLNWPGGYSPALATLQDYCNKLVQGDYLKAADLPKILSAPGATCTATSTTSGSPPVTTVTLSGTKSALKVYPVTDANNSNTVFATTSNYVYDTAFGASPPNPYGDKGFVVIRKGGDASVLKKSNASAASGAAGTSAFESQVGKKPGEVDGTVSAGDPTGVLTYP